MSGRSRSELADLLQVVHAIPDEPGSVVPAVAARLTSLLDADQGVLYRPAREGEHWQIDFFESTYSDTKLRLATAAFLASAPRQFARYDPARIAAHEANQPVLIDPAEQKPGYNDLPIVKDLMMPVGLGRKCQTRLLICDGPALLGWVGGFRDKPFGRAAVEVLRQLTPPLRARLKLEQQLAVTRAYQLTLFHAIDALENPAFLLCGDRIEHANPAGRDRLAAECDGTWNELKMRLRHNDSSYFTISQTGLPPLKLVTLKPSGRDLPAALRRAQAGWRLSPRQLDVLAHLAEGDTNKEIACKLGCAEVTIEFHLRGIFNKTGAQNRSELVAQFWRQA